MEEGRINTASRRWSKAARTHRRKVHKHAPHPLLPHADRRTPPTLLLTGGPIKSLTSRTHHRSLFPWSLEFGFWKGYAECNNIATRAFSSPPSRVIGASDAKKLPVTTPITAICRTNPIKRLTLPPVYRERRKYAATVATSNTDKRADHFSMTQKESMELNAGTRLVCLIKNM